MTLRPILPILFFAMCSALPGQDALTPMRKGNDALASDLWEMAALHFNECLATADLEPKAKSEAATRLAEAWIREWKAGEGLGVARPVVRRKRSRRRPSGKARRSPDSGASRMRSPS